MATLPCAKCNKPAYPTEQLKVLDKTWHKGCFACDVCGIKLTLKTYVALNKVPYCQTHYPKPAGTTVAETPEIKRLAQNTKIQSQVHYTAEHQKHLQEFTAVSDTPELLRAQAAQRIQSDVSYAATVEANSKASARGTSTGVPIGGVQLMIVENKSNDTPEHSQNSDVDQNGDTKAHVYKALYTYQPDADDEVGFQVGDEIIDAVLVAEGWLQGTNPRTGKTGLLPEPYVSLIR